MKIFSELQNTPVVDSEVAFTFGMFDGVHLGHQYIFSELTKTNKKIALLTFSNHPSTILTPDNPTPYLTTLEQKLALFEQFGFDVVIHVQFDEEMKNLSAKEFLEKILVMVPFSALVVGSDARFGKDRLGDRDFLKQWEHAFSIRFLQRFSVDGVAISSSIIRKAIYERDLEAAAKWLGRPYAIGLDKVSGYVLPPPGIYEARVEGRTCEVAIKEHSVLEISEIGYDSRALEVQLIKFLREGP